jgi:hypothetical protein
MPSNPFFIQAMPMRLIPFATLISLATLALSGCATTQFQSTGQNSQAQLCQGADEKISALILWGPKWRPNQKDVPMREAAAGRGIEHFFTSSGCFATSRIVRKIGDREAIDLDLAEARALVPADVVAPSKLLFIAVRELGPILKLQLYVPPVEGGTDVVLDIRAASLITGETIADFTAHWQNGGPWVIKGVGTLERDIGSALQEALKPVRSSK